MADLLHPQATHHLPSFITPPGDTDVLMVVTGVFLLCAVVGFGVLFLRLHALPEHIAHGSHKVQMELVSVLCLIALFTHMHIFWVIGLMLALVDLPDFGTPLNRIAGSTEKMAGLKPGEGFMDVPDPGVAAAAENDASGTLPEPDGAVGHASGRAYPGKAEIVPARQKELGHA